MFRSTLMIAVFSFPFAALAEGPAAMASSEISGPAQTSGAGAPRPYIQTYDPSSAYDGYWVPSSEKFVCKDSVDPRCMTE